MPAEAICVGRRPVLTILAVALVAAAACGAPADDGSVTTGSAAPPATSAEPRPALAPTTSTTSTTTPTSTSTTVAPTTVAPTSAAVTAAEARPGDGCVILDDAEVEADGSWFIVNDGVMGGRSSAAGGIEDSVLTFTGEIVTDGGGFSSVRLPLAPEELAGTTRFLLRLRTDGRQYAITADDALPGRDRRVSHQAPISAVGEGWELVEVRYAELRPQVFGTPVDDAPFAPEAATEVGIILNDGLDGPFTISIDWLAACP